jgi:GTP-binding protein
MITIGIIWLPNAGKSTLFNRLIGNHRAIITDIAGTTRDIISESFVRDDHRYKLMDSPWLTDQDKEMSLVKKIIDESDYCFFVIDGQTGLNPNEQHIAQMIIKAHKQWSTCLLVNKLERALINWTESMYISDYYSLWFGHVIAISAQHGANLDLVRDIIDHLPHTLPASKSRRSSTWHKAPTQHQDYEWDWSIRIALLGKPNAGKSTLLNTLCHEPLASVSEIPGTTLDYLTGHFQYRDQHFTVYDTAGLRRKSIVRGIESIANSKTFAMLKYIRPIVLVIVDGTQIVSRQDLVILSQIINLGLPSMVLVNKVDLIDDLKQIKKILTDVQQACGYAPYIPVLWISAQTGHGLTAVYKHIIQIHQHMTHTIPTPKLNAIISKAFLLSPPKFPKNKICKCKYITQISSNPIVFKVFVNTVDRVNFAMKRRIENVLRKECDLTGVPFEFDFVASPDHSKR